MFELSLFVLLLASGAVRSCPLKTVDSRAGCYCGIEIDGTNYIQCQPYSMEVIPEFTRSYVYDKFNLSFNFIHNITQDSFKHLKVKSIYLQQNLIEFIDRQAFVNHNLVNYLEELHIDMLSNGSLDFLCAASWPKLRILELSGFDVTSHYQSCLGKFHRLEKLIIRHSQISLLSYHIYKLANLHELSLSHNQLEYLNFDQDLLTYASSIRILNLTHNQLRSIPNDLLDRMPQLATVDLSHNFIESLPIVNQMNVLTLNLSHNRINYFQLNDNQHRYDVSHNPLCTLESSQSKVDFVTIQQSTRLHCDCRLAFFLKEHLIDAKQTIGNEQPFGNETRCATPVLFRGFLLADLTYEQLLRVCQKDLPNHCRELTRWKQVQEFTREIIGTTTATPLMQSSLATTPAVLLARKLDKPREIPPFRLTSFYTSHENTDLVVSWDFNGPLLTNYDRRIQFQIIVEQDSPGSNQIIRRSGLLSPYLRQYVMPHIPSNKNYYVCLLLTRSSHGTDKYCRETRTPMPTTSVSNYLLTKQAVVHLLFTNRSIVFGFLVGTMLTTGLLLTLAFVCHLRAKRQRARRATTSLYHPQFPHAHRQQQQQQQPQHYLYVDRNDEDGVYSNSIFSSLSSSKYNHFRKNRHRTCFPSLPSDQSWYRRGLTQLSSVPPAPPCCFHHHHHHTPDTTMSSSTTARRVNTLSSQYSNGIDKEPMTSTSIMSSVSSDEPSNPMANSPAKHVYEELTDETTMLRRNHATDFFL